MARVARGDEDAFEELIRQTQGLVAGIIYRYLGHARLTEDLAQETYLRVWAARRRWKPTARVATWIGTIAARLCLNVREPRGPVPPAPEPPEAEPIREAVLALPPSQRIAVVLRYYGGFTGAETAEAMGLSEGAVESLLSRAREALAERWPRENAGEPV